jgi:hypothetical protein
MAEPSFTAARPSQYDALNSAMEETNDRPQQGLEVGFEASVVQGRDESVEDVGDSAGYGIAFGKRPRIGLVLERAVAEDLKLLKDMIGWG